MDNTYKVIILGNPTVGKTELLAKFAAQQSNEEDISTPFKLKGASILKESIELKEFNVIVDLELWNIAGQPLYRPFFNGADGMLLVFDITRSSTFENITNWHNSAANYGLSGIPKILIGNKAHLGNKRVINLPLAKHLCEQLNINHYYETSDLTGYNVKEIFEKIAELIYRVKVLKIPVKNQKVIVKDYLGEIKIGEIKNTPNCKVIDPFHWLDRLDSLGTISNPFLVSPGCIEIKIIEKKPLTEEQKRERKERAIHYFENERKNIENREKQMKLIEAMKMSEEFKKEKPFIIIPSVAISKTKEERKP